MTNLVQSVISAISPDLISRLSGQLEESPGAIGKGVAGAVSTLFAGALRHGSTSDGVQDLLGLIGRATEDGDPLGHVSGLAADESAHPGRFTAGRALADRLLGEHGEGVNQTLADASGLKPGSAASLIGLAAPLVLGALGKAAGSTPTAAGLQAVLSEQKANILGLLPAGLGGLFGLGAAAESVVQSLGAGAAAATATTAATATAATAAAAKAVTAGGGGLMKLLPWLIGLAILLALLFFGLRHCSGDKEAATGPAPAASPPAASSSSTAPATSTAASETPAPAETLNLPGGSTVSAVPGSIGYDLAKFLAGADPAPKTFVFDNLNFNTGSSTLTPASQATVDTLVTILKAYPNVGARIVGYTDNSGNAAANQALSASRAAVVARQIVGGGVSAGQIETAGRGDADPVADNATAEGRAKNRRTELEIVKK